jgi:hypothetical protein
LDSDIIKIDHVNLNTVEICKAIGVAVAAVVGQELDAVFIAILNLDYCQLKGFDNSTAL